jgi:hypothetical protein
MGECVGESEQNEKSPFTVPFDRFADEGSIPVLLHFEKNGV